MLSSLLDMPFVRQRQQLIPYELAKKHLFLPIAEHDDNCIVAMVDPLPVEVSISVSKRLGKKLIEYRTTTAAIESALEHCYKPSAVAALLDGEREIPSPPALDLDVPSDQPVTSLCNALLKEALEQGISDIHLDPGWPWQIRYRYQGVFTTSYTCPTHLAQQLVSRLKILADMDIAEQRRPQDGHIHCQSAGEVCDLRLSTLPTLAGERLVIRLLKSAPPQLEKLGISSPLSEQLAHLCSLKAGLILLIGPTCSGKSTTLYALLSSLIGQERNVMTIEDPIEYQIAGITQANVNPKIGLDFSLLLRHILRQDPDVLVIGEIRDRESATAAVRAAMTGHLTFATLHACDPQSAAQRLADLGISRNRLSLATQGIVNQRLAPLLCANCRYLDTPPLEVRKALSLDDKDCFASRGCVLCTFSGVEKMTAIYQLSRTFDETTPLGREELLAGRVSWTALL